MDYQMKHIHWLHQPFGLNLSAELRKTLRLLIQHLIVTILLGLQLLSLPLIHALTNVSPDNDASEIDNTHSLLRNPFRLQALLPSQAGVYTLGRQKIHDIYAGAQKIGRIIVALYELGNLLDQNPRLLKSRSGSAAQKIHGHPDIDANSAITSDSINHATASQVYHAALGNDNALDDLLAGFVAGNDSGKVSTKSRRVSMGSALENQRSYQGQWYRNSSIQTTPESMRTTLKASPQQNRADEMACPALITLVPDTSSVAGCPQSAASVVSSEPMSSWSAPTFEITSKGHQESQLKPTSPRLSVSASPTIEGCSKEVARQAEASSRIPKRRSVPGSDRQKYGPIEKRESLASIETLTPTRPNRLQRRVRSPRT